MSKGSAQEEEEKGHYQCFCFKTYKSWTGIYLHLKYKHLEFFLKNTHEELAAMFEPSPFPHTDKLFYMPFRPKFQSQPTKPKNDGKPEPVSHIKNVNTPNEDE